MAKFVDVSKVLPPAFEGFTLEKIFYNTLLAIASLENLRCEDDEVNETLRNTIRLVLETNLVNIIHDRAQKHESLIDVTSIEKDFENHMIFNWDEEEVN